MQVAAVLREYSARRRMLEADLAVRRVTPPPREPTEVDTEEDYVASSQRVRLVVGLDRRLRLGGAGRGWGALGWPWSVVR